METKISIAEIEQLRQAALAKRAARKRVQSLLANVRSGVAISLEEQMEILRCEDESYVQMLLEGYAQKYPVDVSKSCSETMMMSPEAQIYIYENWKTESKEKLRKYLMDEVPLTNELIKRLIDDGEYVPKEQQELSVEMQCYYMEHTFSQAEDNFNNVENYQYFNGVDDYLRLHGLASEAELILITEGLNPPYSRDSSIDTCRRLVTAYIFAQKTLTPPAERALIASGYHGLIMLYIQVAKDGLKEEEALLARGNREEVTAYFERYATL